MDRSNFPKITITGDLGSGKSVIGSILKEKLECGTYSTGDIQRGIAEKYDIDTLELNTMSESRFDIDDEIDSFSREMGKRDESFIMDSRMAWHFMPDSFKIYLVVNINTAAKRILGDKNRKSEYYNNLDEAKEAIIKRRSSEINRFKKYYGIDCSDLSSYDLVVDTSLSNPASIADTILDIFHEWLSNRNFTKFWYPPKRLFPTRQVAEEDGALVKEIVESIAKNGFDENNPILAVEKDDFSFVFKGHKRVSAAILNKLSLIPVKPFFEKDGEIETNLTVTDFLSANLRLNRIEVWEDYHQFKFPEYPVFE